MKQRREVRERIAQRQALQAEVARSIERSTMTVAEFVDITRMASGKVRKEMDAGTIPSKMVGKLRRILLTPEIRKQLIAALEEHLKDMQ